MQYRSRWIVVALAASLLASCSGPLWGEYPTLTPEISPAPTLVTPTLFPTFTPSPIPSDTPIPEPLLPLDPTLTTAAAEETATPQVLYYVQGGDYLPAVAARFGVDVSEISSPEGLNPNGRLIPGLPLFMPNKLGDFGPADEIIPDSEIVFAPNAIDFDVESYVEKQNGFLSTYREYLASTQWTSGAQAVARTARDNSLNPRLLLALIDFESNWVHGQPTNLAETDYPLGNINYYYKGLFRQMMWASDILYAGYYGWRAGSLTEITTHDGKKIRLAPSLNAGTATIQFFFAQTHDYDDWLRIVDPHVGFAKFYNEMFGDPWLRAQSVEPLLPPGLEQPQFILPFERGKTWSYSGGPHAAWDRPPVELEMKAGGAALDFAPSLDTGGCEKSDAWVLAMASGLVVRSDLGVVVVDLDGDGNEQTGWNVLYLHIASKDHVPLGTWVNQGDKLGHPSCEGGVATGTHVHIVRKYNGEWVLADGPIPFNMDGWVAHNGDGPYKGTLTRGDKVVTACACGSFETRIIRDVLP
jgi:LasA protease